MVGSFVVLALIVLLYLTAQTLIPQFAFLSDWLPYMYWAIWVAVAIFSLFVIAGLFNLLFNKPRK
jgi:hypothetical protein